MGTFSFLSKTGERFFAPLLRSIFSAGHSYQCHAIKDEDWILSGICRVADKCSSGRAFVEKSITSSTLTSLKRSSYFDALASSRRLKHLRSISDHFLLKRMCVALVEKTNQLSEIDGCIPKLHIFADDGHFHGASSHDVPDEKGTKNAVGHLYVRNLRNGDMQYLALASASSRGKKKPHDMGVLKELSAETLRLGASTGEKVLYVWDRAPESILINGLSGKRAVLSTFLVALKVTWYLSPEDSEILAVTIRLMQG
jgi:hypothetical protein